MDLREGNRVKDKATGIYGTVTGYSPGHRMFFITWDLPDWKVPEDKIETILEKVED